MKEVIVGEGIEFIRPSKLAEDGFTGTVLTGTYLGPVLNNLTEKNDYKFQVGNDIKVINNTGGLQSRMELVEAGSIVQIIYEGKNEIETGRLKGKSAHAFRVLIDDGSAE